MKMNQVFTAVLVVSTLVALIGSPVLAADLADERAVIDLNPTLDAPAGASGTVELRLRIDETGVFGPLRARLSASGLIPDTTYSLLVERTSVVSGTTDNEGAIIFDGKIDQVAFNVLIGL